VPAVSRREKVKVKGKKSLLPFPFALGSPCLFHLDRYVTKSAIAARIVGGGQQHKLSMMITLRNRYQTIRVAGAGGFGENLLETPTCATTAGV